MSGTAAPSRSARQTEVINDSVRDRAQAARRQTTSTSQQEKIRDNTFFKVMFGEGTPQAKRDAVAKALTFTGTKQESRAAVAAFEEFREFLQATREEMSRETIKLTDTEAMSELQSGYRDFNDGIVDFEEAMKPLTDIIDAVYTLRTKGKTFEIFKLIRDNREAEKIDVQRLGEINDEITLIQIEIANLKNKNAGLSEQRGFFGFGGIKEEARVKIAQNEETIKAREAKLAELRGQIETIEAARVERKAAGGEFAFETEKLSELLDLTSDEHKDRQRAVVQKALDFVETTKTRTTAIRGHLTKMTDQIDSLFDGNQNMSRVYAMMGEALKQAEEANQTQRQTLSVVPEGEDEIEKNIREEKRMNIEQHMSALDSSTTDTITTQAELTKGTIRIKNMRDANSSQLAKIRTMQGQGVAGTAERLASTLNAVSAAAVGESQALAKDSMLLMNQKADAISSKESIRLAMATQEINDDLLRALDDMQDIGETTRTSLDISRANISDMRENLDRLQALAKDVGGDIKDTIAVNAEVSLNRTGKSSADKGSDEPKTFGIGSV